MMGGSTVRTWFTYISCVIALCSLFIGCGGGGDSPPPPAPSTPQSQTLTFAQAGPLSALLHSTTDNAATSPGTGATTYTSSNTNAVRVNETTGAATAVGLGSSVITATKAADSNYLQAQASYTIHVQTASTVNAWIGSTGAQVFLPQAANGKQFGRARVSDCDVADTVATCDLAELSAVTAATSTLTDTRATLTTPAYYALVDGQTVGSPIIASTTRFSDRIGHAAVRFNERYWVIGGATPITPRVTANVEYMRHADVWSSADGSSWKLETASAAFGPRWLHRAVVYQDAIWLISGHAPTLGGAQGINDVWRSTDGVNWALVANAVPLLPPMNTDPVNLVATVFNDEIWVIRNGSVHSTANGVNWTSRGSGPFAGINRANATLNVFQGRLWYIGGTPNFVSGVNGQAPTVNASNDVFRSSDDGSTWEQLTAPPFSGRFRHSSFVRNGRLWVFGGQNQTNGAPPTLAADAWSTDGATWTQEANTGRLARGFFLATVEETSPARVTILGGVQGTFTNQVWQSSGVSAWTHRSAHAQFPARHAEALDFNGYFWMIGGATTNASTSSANTNEVWRSTDGLNWASVAPSGTTFTPRDGHRAAVFNNRIWVIGGWENPIGGSGTRYNDVWSSADGAAWTQHATPPFDPRVGHDLVAYNGRLWVISGSTGNGFVNDVWSSSDGESWRSDTTNAAFSARSGHQAIVFNDAMWLIAGGDGTSLSDAWSSTDGATWTQRTAPGFPARTWHSLAVMNGRLYVVAGASSEDYETATRYNDVWSTADGASWRQDTPSASFTPRGLGALVARNNELWLIGGLGLGFRNDVWRSEDAVNWRVGFSHDILAP